MSVALAESAEHCRAVCRARGRNFYYGLKLTPEPKRSALFAIYAWMRAIDDAADEPERVGAASAEQAVSAMEQRTAELFDNGRVPEGSMWPAFADAYERYRLPRSLFEQALEGVRSDLVASQGPRHLTEADLDRYCERVASTVGRLCVRVWGLVPGADAERADELARLRGIAFQRTNILRDLREDAESAPPRVYVAREAMERFGIEIDGVLKWSPADRSRAFVLDQVAKAVAAYQTSAPLDAMVEPSCRPVLRAMTRIYRGLLDKIERSPERVVGPAPVRLSSARKTAIALGAMAKL